MRIMREYIKNRRDRNGIMWYFTRNLDIEVVKVNPETDEIDDIKKTQRLPYGLSVEQIRIMI